MSDGAPSEKTYWRSVGRLLDSPAVREEILRELPPDALTPPDEVTRRGVLQLLAASFGLAGLTACRRPVEHIVPYVDAPEGMIPGVAKRYATALPMGTDALGLVVETHDGRPTKVEGNPLHPSSHGAASAWAQASILGLYDPDRASRVWKEGEGSDWEAFATWWAERAAALGTGAGLAVLASPFASPTLARLARALRARFPESRFVAWEPVSDELAFTAHGGSRPVYHLDRAKVVAAIDCDLLLTESNAVHNAWSFAQARRPERAEGMARLYAVESALSLTGANADHRLALSPRHLPSFVAALARELGVAPGVEGPREAGGRQPSPALPAAAAARVAVLARDLRAAGAAGVVAVGRRQPAALHAVAMAINRALGSVGSAVTLHPLEDVAWSTTAELGEMVAAMAAGSVDTLVVLGGNPAYDAPADLDFAAALAKVPNTVCHASHRHETGALCHWLVPEAHPFEAWGDVRSADGTVSVVQPLIAPLLGGVGRAEMLSLLAEGQARTGHELVRETWAVGADETVWRKALHDGLAAAAPAGGGPVRFAAGVMPATAAAGSAESGEVASTSADAPGAAANGAAEASTDPFADEAVDTSPAVPSGTPLPTPAPEGIPTAVAESPAAPAPALGEGGLDLVILPSPILWDGAGANNAWLQELPHPLSKLTWDNAAYLSPATAERVGVESGGKVIVIANGRKLSLPAMVLPGVAEDTVVVELGYGREAAGRVGSGVGGNAYRLRSSTAMWGASGVVARETWGEHLLAVTQDHWELEGRTLVRETSLAGYRDKPEFARDPEIAVPMLWERPTEFTEGPQWAMAIDLTSCIGCNACVIACQSENNVPVVGKDQVSRAREMHWLRVDRYFAGEPESPEVVFQPVPCMHCENAPCEQVCPVAATVHDQQGLNLMVYNRCIGTRYCSNNCPYKVRRFNFYNFTKDTPDLVAMAANPDVTVRARGVMEKCTYCIQRVTEAKSTAKTERRPLRDGDVKTACQQTCPTEAIVFGDRLMAQSRVMEKKGLPRDYVLLGELANVPRTSYQAKIRNPNPEWT
jgi:MoCo/4Fe-4S cofactor protein with predicted Tat translocation signal